MICFCSSSKVKNSVVDAQSTADACPSQHRRRPGRRRPWSVVVDYWPGIPRLGVGCFGCVVLHPPSVKVPRLPFFMLVGGHADLSGSPRRPAPEGDLRRSGGPGGHPSWMASSSEEDGGWRKFLFVLCDATLRDNWVISWRATLSTKRRFKTSP